MNAKTSTRTTCEIEFTGIQLSHLLNVFIKEQFEERNIHIPTETQYVITCQLNESSGPIRIDVSQLHKICATVTYTPDP